MIMLFLARMDRITKRLVSDGPIAGKSVLLSVRIQFDQQSPFFMAVPSLFAHPTGQPVHRL
jgi:hypothetical protein